MLLVACVMFGEATAVRQYEPTVFFCFAFFVSSFLAVGLNVATYVCNRLTSPTTVSVTGNLKNVACDLVGVIVFDDVVLTWGYVSGIIASTFGGFWFSLLS